MGTVIHAGTNQPLENANIHVYGYNNSPKKFMCIYCNNPSVDGVSYDLQTDKNGKFNITIDRDNVFMEVTKQGYHWIFPERQARDLEITTGKVYSNIFKLDYLVESNPIFKSKGISYNDDTLWFDGSGSDKPYYESLNTFIGKGPFSIYDYWGALGDKYKKFYIKLKRKGTILERKDSVFVKSIPIFSDTIYY